MPLSPESWPAGGGGSAVHTHEEIMGGSEPVTITPAGGSDQRLKWVSNGSGDDLFDLTAPTAPVVIDPGVYSVVANLRPDGSLAPGEQYEATLHMDRLGEDAISQASSGIASAIFPSPHLSLALTWYMPAGAIMTVAVQTSVEADFIIEEACIQRIS